FQQAANGKAVVSPVYRDGGHLRWVVAHPVLGTKGNKPVAVVMGDLRETTLARFLHGEELGRTGQSFLVDPHGYLILSSQLGSTPTEGRMLAAGALTKFIDTPSVHRGLAGQNGFSRYSADGTDVLAGEAPVRGLGWAAITQQDASVALSATHDQRNLAIV